jgi:hypothetical protein
VATRRDARPSAGTASTSAWIFSRRLDLIAFGLPVALALALVALGRARGLTVAPTWIFVACVIGVDVAHVHATLYRVYLDGREVMRRPWLYLGTPIVTYAFFVYLHARHGSVIFWRVLAYAAVWHFVRQQVGWLALYQSKEQSNARLGRFDRALDSVAIHLAALYPILDWHARAPRPFSWFLAGDFLVGMPVWIATAGKIAWAVTLVAFAARQLRRWRAGARPSVGKSLVVLGTALTWWLGIVALDDDFAFTVTNVLPHGIPYIVLAIVWAQRRFAAGEPGRATLGRALVRGGALVAYAALFALAFAEEAVWDRAVWHDHERLFGHARALSDEALAWLVPLLALPQGVHYALDGWIWRREGNPELGRYLAPAPSTPK